jgi:hypothetical protein
MVRSGQGNRAEELDSYLTTAGETAVYGSNRGGDDAGGAGLDRDRRPDVAGRQYARLDRSPGDSPGLRSGGCRPSPKPEVSGEAGCCEGSCDRTAMGEGSFEQTRLGADG